MPLKVALPGDKHIASRVFQRHRPEPSDISRFPEASDVSRSRGAWRRLLSLPSRYLRMLSLIATSSANTNSLTTRSIESGFSNGPNKSTLRKRLRNRLYLTGSAWDRSKRRNGTLDKLPRFTQKPRAIRATDHRWSLPVARALYAHRIELCGSTYQDDASGDAITVVCVSDTHGAALPLPEGDLLVHAGDMTAGGTFYELQAQLRWLAQQPHEHKVVIAGNHDTLLDSVTSRAHRESQDLEDAANEGWRASDLDWGGITYLQDESTTLRFRSGREISVYGNAFTNGRGTWAFQYARGTDYWRGRIPAKTDLCLIHGPPKGHLDLTKAGTSAGCKSLLEELYAKRPRTVVCGHVHRARGVERLAFDDVQRAWEQILVKQMGWRGVARMAWGLLRECLQPGRGGQSRTRLVNAAVLMHPRRALEPATVVKI